MFPAMVGGMIALTPKGLYCEAGGFHIDPSRSVDVALITHAHSDHARRGSRKYYCENSGKGLLARRVGGHADITGVAYGQEFRFGSTRVSFHPAGHILGSAQIRVEHEGHVWVVSGDYKRELDPSCAPFEVVKCDTFITEATFGDPKYQWSEPGARVTESIYGWWQENRATSRNSVLFAYALGKTQRVLAELKRFTNEAVYVFGEGADLTECYRKENVPMVPTIALESLRKSDRLEGALIIAPHSLASSAWIHRLGGPATAFASGWMRSGAWGMRNRYERGFVLSDHADWPALVRTIEETAARRVLVHHDGGEGQLARYLRKRGIQAAAMNAPTALEAAVSASTPDQPSLFATMNASSSRSSQ